jgi:hypothetical protein
LGQPNRGMKDGRIIGCCLSRGMNHPGRQRLLWQNGSGLRR